MSIAYEPAAYTPAATPTPRKSRVPAVIISLLVVALIAVGLVAFSQHNQVTETKADLASTSADLKDANANLKTTEGTLADTQETLTTAQDDLTSANGTISQQDDQLSACALVTKMSDHLYEEVLIALRAGQDALAGDYLEVSNKMDRLGTHSDAIDKILDDNGYEYVVDLWAACAPAYNTI